MTSRTLRTPRATNRRLRAGDTQYQRRRGFVVGVVLGVAVTTMLVLAIACSGLGTSPYASDADDLAELNAKFTAQLEQYVASAALRGDELAGRTLVDLSKARDGAGEQLADALNQRAPAPAADNTPDNAPAP